MLLVVIAAIFVYIIIRHWLPLWLLPYHTFVGILGLLAGAFIVLGTIYTLWRASRGKGLPGDQMIPAEQTELLANFLNINTRPASILRLDEQIESAPPTSSHFGKSPVGLAEESWPTTKDGTPFNFICQLNLKDAPGVPDLLRDVELITFFVHDLPGSDGKYRDNYVLRIYKSLEGLRVLEPPIDSRRPKFGMLKRGMYGKWEFLVKDHPDVSDADLVEVDGFGLVESDIMPNEGTKLGGYPSLIQHEASWGKLGNLAKAKYCFQIDSEGSVGLNWVDGGCIYIARGTAPGHEDEWFVDCQFG